MHTRGTVETAIDQARGSFDATQPNPAVASNFAAERLLMNDHYYGGRLEQAAGATRCVRRATQSPRTPAAAVALLSIYEERSHRRSIIAVIKSRVTPRRTRIYPLIHLCAMRTLRWLAGSIARTNLVSARPAARYDDDDVTLLTARCRRQPKPSTPTSFSVLASMSFVAHAERKVVTN